MSTDPEKTVEEMRAEREAMEQAEQEVRDNCNTRVARFAEELRMELAEQEMCAAKAGQPAKPPLKGYHVWQNEDGSYTLAKIEGTKKEPSLWDMLLMGQFLHDNAMSMITADLRVGRSPTAR